MREIRLSGSEGGGTEANRSSLPLSQQRWIPAFDKKRYVVLGHPNASKR